MEYAIVMQQNCILLQADMRATTEAIQPLSVAKQGHEHREDIKVGQVSQH